ncbi:discoidin domain-containing protein [Cohnella terricola]|nr:discoidin domain-containing protein [Cohnella terricola]
MARMNVSIPNMSGASYHMEQLIASGEVTGEYTLNNEMINTTSWMQATDTTSNLFVTKISFAGSSSKNVSISFNAGNNNNYGITYGSSGDVLYADVRADNTDQVGGVNTRKVRIATRIIGATGTISSNNLNFTLQPGGNYTLITSIMSNSDSGNYQTDAINNINTKTQSDINHLNTSHQGWWTDYWSKSFVNIPNKVIEKNWYGSLYLLGSSIRGNEYAAGLWGNWIFRDMDWLGDFHLNYNYEVPYYALYPTNHVDISDSYDQPLLDWIPKGKASASALGYSGIYYPVGIGPLPNGSGDSASYLNQKSNAAFAATNMLMRYYYTRDTAYANKVYAYLKETGLFWESYLVYDGTRYVIQNDAQNENDPYPQTNGTTSLALVRYLFKGLIDMSTDLNLDASKRATWQNILDKLSAYPTYTYNGKTIYRFTEIGSAAPTSALGTQMIFPANQIGADSDAATKQIAYNTVEAAIQDVFNSDGHSSMFFPAAVRVGYDPNLILTKLTTWLSSYNNFYVAKNGGGLETLANTPLTLHEMLGQSFQGTLHLFANWPTNTPAKFGDFLTDGGFLVSSGIENNQVQYMRVISQKGKSLTFVNPWPGQTLQIYRNGSSAGTLSGSTITITTSVNETIHIAPSGTPYSNILTLMGQPISTDGNSSNLALNKAASATDEFTNDGRYASTAVDGDANTFWSSNLWANSSDYKWLTVDLGQSYNIQRWVVTHAGGTSDTRDFKLQKSTGNASGPWVDVDTVTGNTSDVTDRTVASFSARYVRLYITNPVQSGSLYSRIREFELYPSNNVALNKAASATDEYTNDGRYASTAVDGDANTFWSSNLWANSSDYKWLTVDLGQSYNIQRWVVTHAGGTSDTRDFKLQKSTGNASGPWVDVDTVTGNTSDATDRTVASFSARYVRVYITNPVQSGGLYSRIREFELY